MTLSLAQRRVLTATASTKRNTATASGQSAAAAYLTSILVSKPLQHKFSAEYSKKSIAS
jgi:hypothetical protein